MPREARSRHTAHVCESLRRPRDGVRPAAGVVGGSHSERRSRRGAGGWRARRPTRPARPSGVAWPQGAHPTSQTFAVQGAGGAAIPSQTWPLAFWPDGSLKWTAHALGALENPPASLRVVPAATPALPASPVKVTESKESVTVETGVIRATLPRTGKVFLSELTRSGKPILTDGRLVSLRCNAPELAEDAGTLRQQTRGGRRQAGDGRAERVGARGRQDRGEARALAAVRPAALLHGRQRGRPDRPQLRLRRRRAQRLSLRAGRPVHGSSDTAAPRSAHPVRRRGRRALRRGGAPAHRPAP